MERDIKNGKVPYGAFLFLRIYEKSLTPLDKTYLTNTATQHKEKYDALSLLSYLPCLPFHTPYHAPHYHIQQDINSRQCKGGDVLLPKSGGVAFCGLARLHGNIGAVSTLCLIIVSFEYFASHSLSIKIAEGLSIPQSFYVILYHT